MKRFVEGEDRKQAVLLPEYLEDYVSEDNPVRVVDVFVDELDLHDLGFDGTAPAATGRPSYHPSVLLKIYIYGYLNRIQSSRRLERETQRNIELMWLTGRLSPDFKTIADFRRSNGKAIRNVCSQFIVLCRNLDLFSKSIVAIDGSKFKAVNNRDRNFTSAKVKARLQQIDRASPDIFPRWRPQTGLNPMLPRRRRVGSVTRSPSSGSRCRTSRRWSSDCASRQMDRFP